MYGPALCVQISEDGPSTMEFCQSIIHSFIRSVSQSVMSAHVFTPYDVINFRTVQKLRSPLCFGEFHLRDR
jgi:hypothetical protein